MGLEQRVERLERENRRLKLAVMVVTTLVGAVLVGAATPQEVPEMIKEREFRLVDANDHVIWQASGLALVGGSTGVNPEAALAPANQPSSVLLDEINRDVLLRLLVSDSLREVTGLWRDRLHWRILILDADAAASDYWEGVPSQAGKKTVAVLLDLPNGIDGAPYRETYPTLEEWATEAVAAVLQQQGWQEAYLPYAFYLPRQSW